MKIILLKSLIIFACFFSVTSCENDKNKLIPQNETKSETDGITIEDAKIIFDKYSKSLSSSNSLKNKRKNWKKDPIWKVARKEKFVNDLDVVVVQLDDSIEQPILKIYDNNNDEKQLNTIRKLIIYKDEENKEVIDLLYIIPSNSYHNSHRGLYSDIDFEGKFWIENIEGDFKHGYEFKNGKIIAEYTANQLDTSNMRTSCIEVSYPVTVTTDWISRACAGGNCYDQYMYSETTTRWVSFFECNGPRGYSPITTSFSKYADDEITSIFIQANYIISAPDRPIVSLAKTLECFGKRADYADDNRYKYTFSIYNDEPLNGTAKLINVDLAKRKAGHTYIGLERRDSQTGQVTGKVIGFYPQSSWQSSAGWNVQGVWGDDGNTSYDEVIKIPTNAQDFYNTIDKLSGPTVQSTYNIQGGNGNFDGQNCVSMAKSIFEDYLDFMPSGMGLTPFGWSYTPADLGADIRANKQAIEGQYGVVVEIGMFTSPQSVNCRLNR